MQVGDSVASSHLRRKKGWNIVVILDKPFDPVATTTLAELAKLDEDGKKGVVVMVKCEEDSTEIDEWRRDIERALDVASLGFPISGLSERNEFGCGSTIVVVDPNGLAQWISRYPPSVGQNLEEVLRTLEALQMSYDHDVATGANWAPGRQDVFCERGEVEIKPWFKLSACTSFTTSSSAF